MPYREWLESDVSVQGVNFKSCHDCHMEHAAPAVISRVPNRLARREGFSRHTFFTENVLMLEILRDNARELSLGSSDFDNAIDSRGEYLGGAGSVDIEYAYFDEDVLEVSVQVSNFTGHKMPTSIPITRIFVHLTVFNSRTGGIVFESGRYDDGKIAGVDADDYLFLFEPHHSVIETEDQVQVYEAIMTNTDNQVSYTLLRAADFAKDNRIPPVGFDKLSPTLPWEVKPAGLCLLDDALLVAVTGFSTEFRIFREKVPVIR